MSPQGQRLERLKATLGAADRFQENDPPSMRYDEKIDLQSDVRNAVETLDSTDQQICAALANGESIHRIAKELGCGWNTVKRRVDRIRDFFQSIGLVGWIKADSTERSGTHRPGPLLITARSAAAMCGKSVRTWRTWDAMGRIPQPVRIGRSTFWRVNELHEWVGAGCPSRTEWEALRNGRK